MSHPHAIIKPDAVRNVSGVLGGCGTGVGSCLWGQGAEAEVGYWRRAYLSMGVGIFLGPEKPLPTLPLVVAAQLPSRSRKLNGRA